MKLTVDVQGDWSNTMNWVKKLKNQSRMDSVLRQVGELGESALSAATPVGETGETARGWNHTTSGGRNVKVEFYNNAHPEESVNIAKIIELGHGTGTGGYVPPRPYIKQAMAPVWSKASQLIDKELRS